MFYGCRLISKTFAKTNKVVLRILVTANYLTTQPGAIYGLRLVLWINQSDAYVVWSPAAGYKVGLSFSPFNLISYSDTSYKFCDIDYCKYDFDSEYIKPSFLLIPKTDEHV